MKPSPEESWQAVQAAVNECLLCRSDPSFDLSGEVPARPPWPRQVGRILFVSEAPPVTGGFWRSGEYDDLREQIFRILQARGLHLSDVHSDSALEAFLGSGLFLVQTLKWPLGKGTRKKRPSFSQLGPVQRKRLLAHSIERHLGPEIGLIAPRAVLALGGAAWNACQAFIPDRATLQSLGVREVRGQEYRLALRGGLVPFKVTLLPVGQNMRNQERALLVRKDVTETFSE